MNIIDRKLVLSLNAGWQPIGVKTVADAFVSMMGGNADNPPVKALDISYPQDKDGNYDFENPSIVPVTWAEWLALPIREFDLVVNTSKHKIRVPSVIVSVNFNKMPKKKFRPTKALLYELQKGICGLTGKKISFKQANLEHKIPKSFGGKDTFENLMVADAIVNSKRGNKPYEELGLKPLFNHKEPAPMPVNYVIKKLESHDWKWFLDLD